MSIHGDAIREGWRDYTGGVDPAEIPASWHAFIAGAEYGRKAALLEAARRDALLNNAYELLAMKPPTTWTTPERAFAEALAFGREATA